MEIDFRGLLAGVLEENEKNTRKLSDESLFVIQDYLFGAEYGVCLGCHTRLKRTLVEGAITIRHVEQAPAPNCEYAREYDMVPEWAFFPQELFEE